MRVEMLFARPVEDTLHGGDVDDPGRSAACHLALQLSDEVKWHDRVHYLRRVAVQQRHLLQLLHPRVGSPFVRRLSEFVQFLSVYFARKDGKRIGKDTGKDLRRCSACYLQCLRHHLMV